MDEISNKTLATLLVVAIVISLAGTFFAMRGVSQVTNYVSGYQSLAETGTAKVNITEVTEITLTRNAVDFGKGTRNASAVDDTTACLLTTNTTAMVPANCWEADGGTYSMPHKFVLENTGNTYVAVNINSSNATTFFGGVGTGGTALYQFSGNETGLENGCTGALTEAYTAFDATAQTLCTNMSPALATDTFGIDIQIAIPRGITGAKSQDVGFVATKSG
jgi:hypothetical protein